MDFVHSLYRFPMTVNVIMLVIKYFIHVGQEPSDVVSIYSFKIVLSSTFCKRKPFQKTSVYSLGDFVAYNFNVKVLSREFTCLIMGAVMSRLTYCMFTLQFSAHCSQR